MIQIILNWEVLLMASENARECLWFPKDLCVEMYLQIRHINKPIDFSDNSDISRGGQKIDVECLCQLKISLDLEIALALKQTPETALPMGKLGNCLGKKAALFRITSPSQEMKLIEKTFLWVKNSLKSLILGIRKLNKFSHNSLCRLVYLFIATFLKGHKGYEK